MSEGRVEGYSAAAPAVVEGVERLYEIVEPRVRRLVSERLGVDAAELVRAVSLRDELAADALDLLELALALEGEFGISVPRSVLEHMRSYGDLVDATAALLGPGREAETGSEAQPARFWTRRRQAQGAIAPRLRRQIA